MIRIDHLLHKLSDVAGILIGRLHQLVELAQENIDIERDRTSNVDEIVLRFLEAFLGHELFLIQLLARAQAGVLDLDIAVRRVSGQADQVSGQRVDLDRLTHVEHEDLAAVCVSARLKHQADRLRDRHKIADDIGMGDRYRAALRDLLLEERDDRTVAAQHVAKAHRDEFGLRAAQRMKLALLVDHLLRPVGEQLRNLGGLALLDLVVKGLNDHLAQALGRAHDIGRIDRFIRADQHEALAAVADGGVGGFIGADRVVLDRLARAVLHQRHMLVRRRVVHDLRPELLKDTEDLPAVAHRADNRPDIQLGVLLPQFQLDIIGVVFIDVKNDELPGLVLRDLPAKLGADAAAAARDQDNLSLDVLEDLVHVRTDRIAAEQIFHGDILHFVDGNLARIELIHTGQVFQFAVGLAADIQNVPLIRRRSARQRDIDFFDLILPAGRHDAFPAAFDRNAVDVAVPFVRIVVDKAADLFAHLGRSLDVPQDHLSRSARAHQHDVLLLLHAGVIAPAQQQDEPVCEADAQSGGKLHQNAKDVVGYRHALYKELHAGDVRDLSDSGRDHHAAQFTVAGKAPDAPIQPQRPEHDDAEQRVNQRGSGERPEIGFRNRAETAVKPQPQRQKIRKSNRNNIVQHEDQIHGLPVLQTAKMTSSSRSPRILLIFPYGNVLCCLLSHCSFPLRTLQNNRALHASSTRSKKANEPAELTQHA